MRFRISFPALATTGLLLAIVIVASISYMAWSSLHGIVKDLGDAARPDLRLVLTKDIAYALTDAENSVQAYVVAPDSANLSPYFDALSTVDAMLDSLHKVSRPDSSQAENDTLALLVGEKFAVMDSMLALRQPDFMDSALKKIAGGLKESQVGQPQALPQKAVVSKDKGKVAQAVAEPEPSKEKSGIFKKIFNKKQSQKANSEPAIAPVESIAQEDPKPGATSAPVDVRKLQKQLIAVTSAGQEVTQRLQLRELNLMHRSQALSVHLRRIISDIETAESASLLQQTKESEGSADLANTIIAIFSITGALLLFFIGYSIFAFARRNAEQKRLIQYAKEQAEQLAEDRERFVATMSHEIRTPMNAILGFSDQMLQGDLNQDQRRHAEIVKDSSLHLLAVVNSVLDFTQLAAGKLKLAEVGYHLREESSFIIELLRQTADAKGIYLKLHMAKEVPEIVIGDPLRYRQVLLNLLNNAIKFTEQGGVTLRLAMEGIGTAQQKLQFQVEDTGIGIPSDRLEAVFGEYEQESAQTKQRFGGTGLGLSITRMLLTLQGGSIRVESTLGKGTTFAATLPCRTGTREDIQGQSSPAAKVQASIEPGLRILVADDEAYNRLLLTTILKHWHATWVEVANGEAALAAFEQGDFDIMILDMKMPILSGLEVAGTVRLHRNPKKAQTPIIALTAGLSAEERMQWEAAGIKHILPKPLLTTSLAAAINSCRGVEPSAAPSSESPAQNMQESAPKIFGQLIKLAHGNLHFVDDLVLTYLRSLETSVPEITAAATAQAWPTIADICHKLIPPTDHVEAKDLLFLLKDLEKSSRSGLNADEIRNLVRKVEKEAKRVAIELEEARIALTSKNQ